MRPGFALADTARFGEDEWRLEPAILQEHVKSLALTFQTVPSRYRLQAKQLFLRSTCRAPAAGRDSV